MLRVSGGDTSVTVFVIKYAMPHHETAESMRVHPVGALQPVSALFSRIDDDHGNRRGLGRISARLITESASSADPAESALRRELHPLRFAEAHRIRSRDARAIGRRAGDRDRPRIDDISFLQRIFSTASIAGLDS
jgi:hypothetical protein